MHEAAKHKPGTKHENKSQSNLRDHQDIAQATAAPGRCGGSCVVPNHVAGLMTRTVTGWNQTEDETSTDRRSKYKQHHIGIKLEEVIPDLSKSITQQCAEHIKPPNGHDYTSYGSQQGKHQILSQQLPDKT